MAGLMVLASAGGNIQAQMMETPAQRTARVMAQIEASTARMRSNIIVLEAQMAATRSNHLALGLSTTNTTNTVSRATNLFGNRIRLKIPEKDGIIIDPNTAADPEELKRALNGLRHGYAELPVSDEEKQQMLKQFDDIVATNGYKVLRTNN